MPTLHLPAAHTDTDVALATEVAHVVGSCELYVTWTHGEGPGLPPEIETFTDEERAPGRDHPVRRARRRDGPRPLGAVERDRAPAGRAAGAPAPREERRRTRPTAEEPYA